MMKNSTQGKKAGSRSRVNKSSVTGRFVSEAYAKKHPATTFAKTTRKGKKK